MNNIVNNHSEKFHSLSLAVKTELNEVKTSLFNSYDLAEANAKAISNKHSYNVEPTCKGLGARNHLHTEKQPSQKMKEWLVVRGVDEQAEETEDMCVNDV